MTLSFIRNLTPEKQKSVDRIIAMEYLASTYRDEEVKTADQNYFKALTSAEKTYIKLLSKDLAQDEMLSSAEKSQLMEATSYYSGLSQALKSRWNSLVAQQVLPTTATNGYKLSASDAAFRTALSPEDKSNLENIKKFRFNNQRILSENLAVEANDLGGSNLNFGVAKFSNERFNYISVKGSLVKNENGEALANYPISIVGQDGKTIAKTSTNASGLFVFEDLPRGDYRVVADGLTKSKTLDTPFFVKGLEVKGSAEGNYNHTVKTNIYFDFDSDELRSEAEVALREIAQAYKNAKVYIELKSHTDAIGADHYNIALSQKRNDRVLNRLKVTGCEC